MKTSLKTSFPPLWDDPDVEVILQQAEEELKRMPKKVRRELFGTDWLPPSPDDFFVPDWNGGDDVPQLF